MQFPTKQAIRDYFNSLTPEEKAAKKKKLVDGLHNIHEKSSQDLGLPPDLEPVNPLIDPKPKEKKLKKD